MRYFLMLVFVEALIAGVLFGSAGRVDLPWVWAVLAIHFALLVVGGRTIDEGLRRERLRPGPGGVDRGFRPMLTAFLLAHLVVAGLDAGRFGWSTAAPAWARGAALAAY